MRVVVVGAGGIGGFLAGAMARAGIDVAVVARGAHLAAIRADGLRVESAALGDFTVQVEATDDASGLSADVVLVTFKSHQWSDALEGLRHFGASGATLVTLQNGVPFWFGGEPLECVDPGGLIASTFARESIVGGVVHSSGEIVSPGHVRQSGRVLYPLGDPDGGVGSRASDVIALLRAARLDPQPESDIRSRAWAKLVNNASLNPVSALCGLTVHAMLADATWSAEVRSLMEEAIAVGTGYGVATSLSVQGQLEVAEKIADVKTSMLQDREAGRPLELDPIVGAVIELGARAGVATPHLERAYEALRAR